MQAIDVPRGLWIEHTIKIGTYDIDFANHVSNISYLRWFEDMRLMLFDKYFPLKGFLDIGKTPVLTGTSVAYKRPIKLFSEPHGVMWISKISKASLVINAELYVDGQLTTTVEHVGVFIDLSTGKAIRVPSICTDLFNTASEDVPVRR